MTEADIKHELQKHIDEKHNGSCRKVTPKEIVNIICKDSLSQIKKKISIDLQISFPIMIYCYLEDIITPPVCTCGKLVKFNNSDFRFAKYCSNKCRFANSEETIKVRKETNIEKYGASNFLASEEGRKKIEETSLKKYGFTNHTKSQQYRDKVCGRKASDETKRKVKESHLKLAYKHVILSYKNCYPLFTLDEYDGVRGYRKYPWHCKTCNKDFQSSIHNGCSPVCPFCKPLGSMHEIVCKQYLDNLGVKYNFNDRKFLDSGKEIDIFIPEKNFGIELCGLYWHSEAGPNYTKMDHITKTEECEENGIKLFTIYDDEMYDASKRRIVLNKIKNSVGLTKGKIFARKCKIVDLLPSTCTKFLEKYHIQGSIGSTYKYGLLYNNRLVAVMTFNKGRTSTGHKPVEGEWELGRYCTIFNFNIVGGASKLLAHFIKNVNPDKIYSYADRRWSSGGMYDKIGFTFEKNTAPNYWYTKGFKTREHRAKYQKHKLKDSQFYDESLPEYKIMELEKFYRTWDCGSKLYTWKKQ